MKPTSASRLFQQLRLVGITGVAQFAVQAAALVSGFIVIYLLPPGEYALYTLAASALGTMTLLADSGITTGVLSQGGKVWNDRENLGKVIATGIAMRKKFAKYTLLISIPILIALLIHHGATIFSSLLIAAAIIPAFLTALSGKVIQIAPKLHHEIRSLQGAQAIAALIRVVINGCLLIFAPFAVVPLLATYVGQWWWNLRLRRSADNVADLSATADPEIEARIRTITRKSIPSAIYFSVSSQMSIWLLSIFGSTLSLASLGALNRLTVVFSVLNATFSYIIPPKFAKLPNHPSLLRKRFIQLQVLLGALCLAGFLFTSLFADSVILILPAEYSDLSFALKLQLGCSFLTVFNTSLSSLNISRGYVLPPQIHIPTNIAILVLCVALIRPTTLVGAIQFEITRKLVAPIVQNLLFFFNAQHEKGGVDTGD